MLDIAEDAESVRPWLVRDPTSGCRTLITSRFADWQATGGIQLYVLDSEPARQFLLARTERTAEGAELAACDDLAREPGYLPLALEQAAAYIAAPGARMDFAGYLRLYREATAELLARRRRTRAPARPGSSLEQNGAGQLRSCRARGRGGTTRASALTAHQPDREPAECRAVVAALAQVTVSVSIFSRRMRLIPV